MILVGKNMIELLLLILMSTQGGFDSAKAHNHVTSLTYEGVWIKRQFAETKDPGPYTQLGNQLAVRGPSNELWFYYGFTPSDGPMIAQAESTTSGMRVRITYDPVCFYATNILLLGPVVVPSPTPIPSPSPTPAPTVKPPLKPCAVGEWCYWTWSATQDLRIGALNNAVAYGCDGQTVFQTGSYIYCQRVR